jgi:hypothetical protein
MKFRGGEFSTGTMRNFQPELTLGMGTCFSKWRKSAMPGSIGRHLQRSSGFG